MPPVRLNSFQVSDSKNWMKIFFGSAHPNLLQVERVNGLLVYGSSDYWRVPVHSIRNSHYCDPIQDDESPSWVVRIENLICFVLLGVSQYPPSVDSCGENGLWVRSGFFCCGPFSAMRIRLKGGWFSTTEAP